MNYFVLIIISFVKRTPSAGLIAEILQLIRRTPNGKVDSLCSIAKGKGYYGLGARLSGNYLLQPFDDDIFLTWLQSMGVESQGILPIGVRPDPGSTLV